MPNDAEKVLRCLSCRGLVMQSHLALCLQPLCPHCGNHRLEPSADRVVRRTIIKAPRGTPSSSSAEA